MSDQPQSTETNFPDTNRIKFLIGLALVGWLLSIFTGWSLKKTHDELKKMTDTYSSAVTIQVPMEVAGKIVYKTITQQVHDTKVVTDHIHDTLTIKSGCGFGVLVNIQDTSQKAAYINPDLFSFGPGTVQAMGMATTSGAVWVGAGYRILF